MLNLCLLNTYISWPLLDRFKWGRVFFLVPPFSLSVSKCLREGRMGGWLESGCGRARACFWSSCGLILGPSFVCFCPFSEFFQSRVPARRIFLPSLDIFVGFVKLKSYRSMGSIKNTKVCLWLPDSILHLFWAKQCNVAGKYPPTMITDHLGK